MTDDLLDIINLKTDYINNSNKHPLNMWHIIQEKLTHRHVNKFIKETKTM